jgi:sugar/nucleoside kinase (ribokinase family)
MPTVEYLAIGHITKDIVPGGYAVGGTSTYSALAAQRLGLRAAMVTAAEPSYLENVRDSLPGIAVHCRASPQTTTFENIYTDLGRIQYLRAVAERIENADVPAQWRDASIVHLGPVAQEYDASIRELFTSSFVGVTPQGWMRRWDGDGRVSLAAWEQSEAVLSRADAVVFSWEDVRGDERLIYQYSQAAPVSVMTLGRRGAVVFERNPGLYFPARKVNLVDSTGAGDVFATAFFVRLHETGNPYEAMRFATVTASCSVEGHGLSAMPDRDTVLLWLDSHPNFHE